MKNCEVLNHLDALNTRLAVVKENGAYEYPRLPVSVLWAITQTFDALRRSAELYEEGRKKVIETYAARDENGQIRISDSGNILFYNEEDRKSCADSIDELLNAETEINLYKIHLSELGVCDSSDKYDSLSLNQMDALRFMIVEG